MSLDYVNIDNCTFIDTIERSIMFGQSLIVNINNCNFKDGRDIFIYGLDSDNVKLKGNTFFNNTKTKKNCVSVQSIKNLFIENSKFEKCSINGNLSQYGGAISIIGGTSNIKNCIFSNNFAEYEGGALFIRKCNEKENCDKTESQVLLQDCLFQVRGMVIK